MIIRRNKCLLCGELLTPVEGGDLQKHPEIDTCEVAYTDEYGVSIDVVFVDPEDPTTQPPEDNEPVFFKTFPYVDDVIDETFDAFQLPKLGGISSGRGWSSVSTFQRCPYLWKRKYLERVRPLIAVESPSLAIGTLVHAFLALHYTGMMTDSPYRILTPEMVHERVRARANPEFVREAWRVFSAYRLYYQNEIITPLAVEHDLRDPRTGESCRYDLIAFLDRDLPGLLPGTYIIESKTTSRFDTAALEGWVNDGEVIGQVALWQKLGLDKRFGELKGTIVNLLGKQKEPRFHRTFVAPDSWRVKSHLEDLRRWEGLINLAQSSDSFPRTRANCISRFGFCEQWSHCASND